MYCGRNFVIPQTQSRLVNTVYINSIVNIYAMLGNVVDLKHLLLRDVSYKTLEFPL